MTYGRLTVSCPTDMDTVQIRENNLKVVSTDDLLKKLLIAYRY